MDQEIVDKVIAAEEEYVYDYFIFGAVRQVIAGSVLRLWQILPAFVGITRYLANDF